MRQPPKPQRVDIEFGEETFPADLMIGFEANHAEDIDPDFRIEVEAGRRGTWIIEFIPLVPIPAGAKVGFKKIENDYRFAWRHQDYWPDARDYVTVEEKYSERALPFECDTETKSKVPAIVTLPDGMTVDERILVRMGDQREGGPGSYVYPIPYDSVHIAAGVLLPWDDAFRRLDTAERAEVEVVPCPPLRRYLVHAPSTVAPDTGAPIVCVPVEINNNFIGVDADLRLEGDGARVLQKAARGGMESYRAEVAFDDGRVTRIHVRDEDRGIDAESNPIRVGGDANLYWGEFHWHGYDASEMNVLTATHHPDRLFRYARDVSRLDFTAPGSHIFRHSPDAVGEWWDMYRRAAIDCNEPGRFVTFLGCEWRDAVERGGDRNLVWRDLDAPIPDPTWRIDEVYERFRRMDALVIPHVGGAPALPYHHDERVEPLCEVTSGHGQFEWFAQRYLQKGYHVGIVGGSDGHSGNPGHPRKVTLGGGRFARTLRVRDSGGSGGPLMAVQADDLTREGIWRALFERRTYASTGARALLDFRINDAPMGSQIQADGDVEIALEVHGTAPIERIDLIRDRFRLHRWEPYQPHVELRTTDAPPDGESYYYLRIQQEDGELLWTSPIWVQSSCGGPAEGLPAWNEPEPIDLESVPDNAASEHLDDLLDYLRTEERFDAFSRITPLKVVDSPRGEYAVFLGFMRDRRIRIHWFYEFELPRLRLEVGWAEYGSEPIWGADWAKPLFENY